MATKNSLWEFLIDHPRAAGALACLALAAAFAAKVSATASIICVIFAMLFALTLVDGLSKKGHWSKRKTYGFGTVTVITMLAYGVWLVIPRSSDLDFQYIFVHIGRAPEYPKDTFVNVIGEVDNNGEVPARVRNWLLTVQIEGDLQVLKGQLFSNSYIWNMTFNMPTGKTVLPAQKAYLPDITATDPIVQNGAKVGFVVFRIADQDWNVFAQKKATLKIGFEDSKGKAFSKYFYWVPSPATLPPGKIPGMPGPEPGPPPTSQ